MEISTGILLFQVILKSDFIQRIMLNSWLDHVLKFALDKFFRIRFGWVNGRLADGLLWEGNVIWEHVVGLAEDVVVVLGVDAEAILRALVEAFGVEAERVFVDWTF